MILVSRLQLVAESSSPAIRPLLVHLGSVSQTAGAMTILLRKHVHGHGERVL